MIQLSRQFKRLGAAAAAVTLVAAGSVALTALPASAHGGMIYPADRVYQCYKDGYAGGLANGQGGNMMPTNPVCVDAIAVGTYSFYTWYGNLLPQVEDKHRETIPDGSLCGPSAKFAAYNAVSEDWPSTELESGQELELQYAAKVPHPGWWYTYITKDDWDPTQPLGWDDLELIDQTLDPAIVSGGPEGPEYRWSVDLPERSGKHIIYEIWERTDSPEAFYNCSDVVFDGDNEPSPEPTDPTDPPTTGEPTDPPTTGEPTDPPTTGEPTDPPTTGEPTDPGTDDPAACSVKFTNNAWSGGFTSEVSVGNSTMDTLNGWNVKVVWKNGELVTQAWNSTATQSGNVTTFSNAAWNGTVAHHGNFNFGFLGTGSPQTPSSVTLNGKPCDIY